MNTKLNTSIIFQLKHHWPAGHLEDKCAKNLKQRVFSEKNNTFELKMWKENTLVDENNIFIRLAQITQF